MKYLYIIVIALAFASCKSNSNAPQKSSKNHTDSLAQVITTTTVKERPMNDELLLNGNISCDIALMRERSASEYRSSLERIDKEVERVIRIMKQLLQFSYARREKIDEENLDNIQMGKILTTFTEATTKLDIIEDFSIIAKEDLLLIALRNLINNARKYSNGKGITITVDRPNIRIEDQGIGIPQTDLKHIFEPFYRAANATSISGHGIGLALAKQILEKSDAKISVTSIEGQGTEFKIRFKRTITAIHQAQHLTKVW